MAGRKITVCIILHIAGQKSFVWLFDAVSGDMPTSSAIFKKFPTFSLQHRHLIMKISLVEAVRFLCGLTAVCLL